MRRFRGSVLLVFLLLPLGLFAHPHMRLFSRFEFEWQGQSLKGMWLEWTFDQFFSADIIQAYDADRDGRFSAKETQAVFANAFTYVSEYYYFTFIREGDKRYNPKKVSDFSAWIDKDKCLVYRFLVDLSPYQSQDIYLAVYDYTFFCDIPYQKDDMVKFDCDQSLVSPSCTVEENKKYPVYYNPLGAADDTTIYYKWKKGLMTFYPKEIHLHYDKLQATPTATATPNP
jgi:ABC-type uncharacterized transport system substrate-binding protein